MLDRTRLARRLRDYPQQTIPTDELRLAAVLVPLFLRNERDHLLLTERTVHLPHHAGEIAFPGGGFQAEDGELVVTALRETEEELGIPPGSVEILGRLDDFYSVYGYHVVPYVGLIPPPDRLQIDRFEIARVIEAPLAHFRDPEIHHVEDWTHRGRTLPVDFYRYGPDLVWGMTAAILRQLLQVTADQA